MILEYLSGPNIITRVLIKERGREERELKGAAPLALKIKEGAINQGMQAASRHWKRPGRCFSSRTSAGTQLCQHLDFLAQLKLFWTSDLRNSKIVNLCCYKAMKLQQQ